MKVGVLYGDVAKIGEHQSYLLEISGNRNILHDNMHKQITFLNQK